MCQSSNDVIPTAKGFVVHEELGKTIDAAGILAASLERKAEEYKDVVKLGRTCLQDAVPITLGQEFGAYAAGIRRMLAKRIADRGAELIGFGISDSIGQPPTGDIRVPCGNYRATPFGPDQTTLDDARKVIRDFRLESKLPRSIVDYLMTYLFH